MNTIEVTIAQVSPALHVGYGFGGMEYWPHPIVSIGGRIPCFYCGSHLDSSVTQCPACGARDWSRSKKGFNHD